MSNPNAFAAAVTTALSAGLLSLAHRLGYVHLDSVSALALAGSITTGVLFVGKQGIGPTLSAIWRGTKQATTGPPKPPAGGK